MIRNIQEECEKAMLEVKRKRRSRWVTEETLTIARDRQETKARLES